MDPCKTGHLGHLNLSNNIIAMCPLTEELLKCIEKWSGLSEVCIFHCEVLYTHAGIQYTLVCPMSLSLLLPSGCSLCEEGQQCSAVVSDDGVRVICKDPVAGMRTYPQRESLQNNIQYSQFIESQVCDLCCIQ